MANDETKQKTATKMWKSRGRKKRGENCRWPFIGWRRKTKSSGEYVCMYGDTYSKSKDQPGKVGSPARGQLNRKNEYFPVRVRA